jgi:hypothetical protein
MRAQKRKRNESLANETNKSLAKETNESSATKTLGKTLRK